MLARRVIIVAVAARKEALECVSGKTRVAELPGRAGSWGESLDRVAALFRSLSDTF
jgi:hypothetical protein